VQRYGPVINYFPGSVLRYGPITNHGTGSELKYGPPVEKTTLEILRKPKNLKRHILDFVFAELTPSNSAFRAWQIRYANAKRGRRLLRKERQRTTLKMK
jgi:hypothetical protein